MEPKASLIINPVRIFGSSFKPKSPVTVVASVVSKSENISFLSYANIITSSNGSFDLSETESIGGTYQGVQQMGLFWSMKNEPGSYNRLQCANPSLPLEYEFKVYNDHVSNFTENNLVCKTKATRLIIAKDVSRTYIRNGRIRGILFCPPGKGPFPAIITLYGGTKKQLPIQDASAILVNNGFVSLALAYFNVDDLPKVYDKVDIEYFEEAVVFLQNLPFVDKNSIGVYGISKGGSIALAMATFLPQIKSVVSMNGSLQSVGGTTSYRGIILPKFEFKNVNFVFSKNNTVLINYEYTNASLNDPSLIPFEKSKADILFVLGLDDKSVNVDQYQQMLKFKMSLTFSKNFQVVTYEGLGHLVDPPYMPVCVRIPAVILPEYWVEYGGQNTQEHALSQIKVWKKVIEFFNCSLKFPKLSLACTLIFIIISEY